MFKKDYGLKMLEEGYSNEVLFNYPNFKIFSITIIGLKQFTTMVDFPYNDEVYALSVDFDDEALIQMMVFSSLFTQEQLIKELQSDPITPRTIDLVDSFSVSLSLKLGNIQKNQNETFLPFLIHKIN